MAATTVLKDTEVPAYAVTPAGWMTMVGAWAAAVISTSSMAHSSLLVPLLASWRQRNWVLVVRAAGGMFVVTSVQFVKLSVVFEARFNHKAPAFVEYSKTTPSPGNSGLFHTPVVVRLPNRR